jgi:uncharacterized membrane protein
VPAANRLSEAIGRFAGMTGFVLVQIVFVGLWRYSGVLISPFDLFPYVFLGVVLALEAVLLTSFVLIRQNRMRKRPINEVILICKSTCWPKRR